MENRLFCEALVIELCDIAVNTVENKVHNGSSHQIAASEVFEVRIFPRHLNKILIYAYIETNTYFFAYI